MKTNIRKKLQRFTPFLAVVLVLSILIGAVALFSDRVSEETQLTTSSFEKEGYSLTRVAPSGPFSAGEDIEVILTEQNSREDSQDVNSVVSMLVEWDSLDPSYSMFDDDSVTITLDGEEVSYTVTEEGHISFDLLKHLLTKERGEQERSLVFHLPDELSSIGTLNFQFDKVLVKQSPKGFSNTYTNAELNKEETLDFSVKVGKITGIEVTSPPDKTTYYAGEDFDATGMVVEKVYETGQKKPISDYTIVEGEDLPTGKSEVQIRYTENGVAYTTETTIEVISNEDENNSVGNLEVGSLIQIEENGSPVNYIVVHQGLPDSTLYDSSCDGTWLLREEVHSIMAFDSTNNDYQNSDVHSYLNGTFLDLFDSSIQTVIQQVKIPYQKGTGNSGSVASGSNGLSTKIFLLGSYELGWTTSDKSNIPVDGASLDYFSGLSEYDTKRAAYYNGTVSEWKLRSPYTTHYSSAMAVRTGTASEVHGELFADDVVDSSGIRPAFILNSTTKVNSTPNADGSYSIDFTGNAYQVKYNANGGSGTMANSDHIYGTEKTLTSNTFTRDGYTFKGWATTADGDVAYEDGASVSNLAVSGVYELYAVWEAQGIELSELEEGTLIQLNEDGSPVNFYLAKHDYESDLNGAGRSLLVRSTSYPEEIKWHSSSSVTAYNSSTINTWLQNTYKGKLDSPVQSLLGTTKIYISGNVSGSGSLTTYSASVFLPSSAESGGSPDGYWSLAEGTKLPIASTIRSEGGSFWTRTPLLRGDARIAGNMFNQSATTSGHYALPAFTLPETVMVNPIPNADGSYSLDYTSTAYQVKYNANGGSGSMDNSDHVYGTAKALTTNTFTRDGYDFLGWATYEDGDVVYADGEVVDKLSKGGIYNLYAVWKTPEFTLQDLEEGTIIQINEDGSPVSFYVAKHNYESGLNERGRTLLVRTVSYPEEMKWHSSNPSDVIYSGSTINTWLQNTYKAKLDPAVQSRLGTTKFYVTTDRSGYGSVGTYSASVFLPSSTEAGNGSDGYWSNAEGSVLPVKSALMSKGGSYWSRTPLVRSDARIAGNGFNQEATTSGHYALPMFTLPETFLVSTTPNSDGSYSLDYTGFAYQVKYNANGGSGTMANSDHVYGTAKALTANTFTRDGYTFKGWSTTASGDVVYEDKASVSNLTTNGVYELYAVWEPITYQVRYNANGGSGTMANSDHVYDTASALTANAFTRTGYTFKGWATSASGDVVYEDKASVSNLTTNGVYELYAVWEEVLINWVQYACSLSYTDYVTVATQGEIDAGCQNRYWEKSTYTTYSGYALSSTDGYYLTGATTKKGYSNVTGSYALTTTIKNGYKETVIHELALSNSGGRSDGEWWWYGESTEVARARSTRIDYIKGSATGNTITTEGDKVPNGGTIVDGSLDGDYVVVLEGSTYYYYEKD